MAMKKYLGVPLLMLTFLGCASNYTYLKAYDGRNRPTSNVSQISGGNIEVEHRRVRFLIEKVNGKSVHPFLQAIRLEGFWRVEVLPGNLKIQATLTLENMSQRRNFNIEAKPGIRYVFAPSIEGNSIVVHWNEEAIP